MKDISVLGMKKLECFTLVDVITRASNNATDKRITFSQRDGSEYVYTYSELYIGALRTLAFFQSLGIGPGRRLVTQIQSEYRQIEVFWACVLGGIVPVLLPKVTSWIRESEATRKLNSIVTILNNAVILVDKDQASLYINGKAQPATKRCAWIVDDPELGDPHKAELFRSQPDDLAYLQFSSGSTGSPKGIRLTHRNILCNIHEISNAAYIQYHETTLGWMPYFHDMGLIGFHLVPTYLGINQIKIEASDFVSEPLFWLKLVSSRRIPILGCPNFALQHVVDRVSAVDVATLDLSCVRLIFNGAEPISAAVNRRFADLLAPAGFDRKAIFPVYGMAEACLAVTFSKPNSEPIVHSLDREQLIVDGCAKPAIDDGNTVEYIGVGFPLPSIELRIVNEQGAVLNNCRIGEVQIRGVNVTEGYEADKDSDHSPFTADGWLKTGDLGFLENDQLTITGRIKDVIFVNGRNIMAADLEKTLGEKFQIKSGSIAACAVTDQMTGRERVVIFVAIRRSFGLWKRLWAIQKVAEQYLSFHVDAVLPLTKLPRTSSGKIQRYKLARKWESGEYDDIYAEFDSNIRMLSSLQAYEAPQRQEEEALAVIWEEILRVERVGRQDNFFDLGGNSLLAVQTIAHIQHQMGRDLELRHLFEYPILKDLAQQLLIAKESILASIEYTDRSQPLALSFAQQRLWFLNHLEGAGAAYHISEALKLCGPLDRNVLKATLDTLIARHEILRTTFSDIDGNPVQVIVPSATFSLTETDLSAWSLSERDAEVHRQGNEEVQAPFDLEQGPLIRGRLFRLADHEHVLFVTMHHIVSDGWSMGVLIREVATLYTAYRQGQPNPLPPLPLQYVDYAQWQRHWFAGDILQDQLNYWKQQLSGVPALLELPTDRPRPSVQSYIGARVGFTLSPELSMGLNELSKNHGVTLYMILYAGWAILLSKLSGCDDLVIGTPVANRRHSEVEGLIGFFVNTLALRTDLSGNPRVDEMLARIKAMALAAYSNQDIPFEQVVEAVQPPRSLSHSPLFQVMLVLQNTPLETLQLSELTLAHQETAHTTAQFDLTLIMTEGREAITGELEYASDLFDRKTLECWIGHFQKILANMIKDSKQRIGELEWLSPAEYRRVLVEFNTTEAPYPSDKVIHKLFEEQVEECPDAVAVVFEAGQLTYAELNVRANQVAHYLRRNGVGPDVLVAICVERSLEMVVGLLGILKAGGAYLPLDPSYPTERIAYMLENAAPAIVLTQARLEKSLSAVTGPMVALDRDWQQIAEETDTNLNPQEIGLTPAHLAYVIYTSGSTGYPKGVAMAHCSLTNLLVWQKQSTLGTVRQRTVQFAALGFDVAFQEVYATLCCGGELVLIHEDTRKDLNQLIHLLQTHGIQRLFVPFIVLERLADIAVNMNTAFPQLEEIITAGEQLRITPAISAFFKLSPNCRLHNQYGPTETHVVTAHTLVQNPDVWSNLPPIGRPISNTRIYILDEQNRPVPIGVTGQIYISGVGVARGYLNRSDLTAERFLHDPFSTEPNTRMYRTGDLGRWCADGNIEYLGRNDFQVKIRGFRIELGEIEAQLARYPQIKEAVVLDREDYPGDRRLVAYLTLRSGEQSEGRFDLDREVLRTHMKTALPEYMVPSAFVILECLPLTPNGKINRKALPAPDLGALSAQMYEAPQGEVEEALAAIWQEILHVERVGRYDNFFDLGGHSLLAVKLVNAINHRMLLRERMRLTDIYECMTLNQLSALINDRICSHLPWHEISKPINNVIVI